MVTSGCSIVAIIFGGALMGLAIIGGTLLMAIKLLRGGMSKRGRSQDADEARMIQEIYQGLSRMEARVENLETLLMEDDKRTTDHEKL